MILPEYTTILFLGIYPEDFPTCNKYTCSTMFITALFIITSPIYNNQNQMSLNGGIDAETVVYIHNHIVFSHYKQ